MDGKLGKLLLAAILAVAVWSAFQIEWVVRALPKISSGSSEVVIRSTFRSSFTDKSGRQHEVITTRGELDPSETIKECIDRHASNFLSLTEMFR